MHGLFVYDLEGQTIFDEQLLLMKGKLSLNIRGYADCDIEEFPGKNKYFLEGKLSKINGENMLALDLMEVQAEEDISFLEDQAKKDIIVSYCLIKHNINGVEGKYFGFKREEIVSDKNGDDLLSLDERISKMIDKANKSKDDNKREVILIVKHKKTI
jgi:hypothetical protein